VARAHALVLGHVLDLADLVPAALALVLAALVEQAVPHLLRQKPRAHNVQVLHEAAADVSNTRRPKKAR
jgi:hypothetical protein